jgi:hypothetical protein
MIERDRPILSGSVAGAEEAPHVPAGLGYSLLQRDEQPYADAPDKPPVPFYDDIPNNIFYDPVEGPTPAGRAPPAAAVKGPNAPSKDEVEKAIKQQIASKIAAATEKGSKECFVNAGEIAKALGDDGQIPKICKAMCDLYNEETDTALHIPPKKQGSAISFKYKIPRE